MIFNFIQTGAMFRQWFLVAIESIVEDLCGYNAEFVYSIISSLIGRMLTPKRDTSRQHIVQERPERILLITY
jgi:hypothetical protein